MKMDRTNVMQEKWDYLIVLDACRYDYFDRLYRDYFDGDLTKKISIGSCTNQWRDKSFPDCYDDIVYISANPQISANLPVYGYLAGEHFHKVHEVWKTGWDSNSGTVLPETLTNAAIEIIKVSSETLCNPFNTSVMSFGLTDTITVSEDCPSSLTDVWTK